LLNDVVFRDCSDAEMWMDRGHHDAGFVQIIQSPSDTEDHSDEELDELEEIRADIVGGVTANHDDGSGFTTVVYFTDEASARAGESKPEFDDWHEGFEPEERRFWDLTDPWID